MIAIVCLDDRDGMGFNGRRQSRDVRLREKVLEMAAGRRLWMAPCSADQFGPEGEGRICVSASFLEEAGAAGAAGGLSLEPGVSRGPVPGSGPGEGSLAQDRGARFSREIP